MFISYDDKKTIVFILLFFDNAHGGKQLSLSQVKAMCQRFMFARKSARL
jgi:hypothetical protein